MNKQRISLLILSVLALIVTAMPISAQDDLACEEGFRAFTHAMGQSCIPVEAQRVVVLDTGELDNALALGAPIVGAPVADALQYQEYLADQLDGISDIGLISEPNLEAILALSPDLILGSMQRYEAIYDQLSQIAPTVLTASLRVPWQENFIVHADALGKSDVAEELLADYDAHVAEVQDVLGDDLETTTISIIRFRPGQVRLYLKSSYIGYILQDVGLQRPLSQNEDVFSSEISLEQIADVDADYIFITGYAQDDSEQARFLESPLWQTLSAVQNGHAIDVNDDTWIAGLGVQAANMVLDDLVSYLAPEEPTLDCEEGFRSFDHAMGASCIPVEPQRVVVLDTGELDNALALGAPIVGAPVADALQYQEYLADQLDGISDIGLISEPNLEAILALSPDLILGSMQRYEAIYDQLSQIAPTVLTASLRVPWQENFVVHADALGKSDLAEELLAEYDAHVAEVQDVLGDDLDTTAISIIRFRPGQVRLYLKSSYIGYILQDVGLQRPASQDEDVFSSEISLEQIADVDADYIFITGYAQDDSEQARFLESPLWQTLSAVQNGHAIDVNDDTWIAGLGVQAANMVLDDLVTYLSE